MAHLRIGLLVAASSLCATPALGGLFEDLYGGLDILATPSGSPITGAPGGGRANGNRFGRLRIVPNEFGQGYRLELDRTFGLDTRGRPEVFDFGNYELQLSGGIQSTLQFTGRGIPTGSADLFVNNLTYALRGKSGGQDVQLIGRLRVGQQLEVNQLGFYSLLLEVNNIESALMAEGVLVDGDLDADFDVGPITIRGNIFFDAAAALLTAIGADTDELETIFPGSPIDRINDEIEAALRQQTEVVAAAITADLEDGALSSAGALEAQDFVGGLIRAIDDSEVYDSAGDAFNVPQPTTLLLVAVLGLVGFRRRT